MSQLQHLTCKSINTDQSMPEPFSTSSNFVESRVDAEKGDTQQDARSEGNKQSLYSKLGAIWDFAWLALKFMVNWLELDSRVRIRSIDACPSGYPKLAAFVDSDPNFMVYRRFGYLRSRALLHQQDTLADLERCLDEIDHRDARSLEGRRALCSRERDKNREDNSRKALLVDIADAMKQYDDMLLRSAAVSELEPPQRRNQEAIARLIWNDSQLAEPDRDYIQHVDDLITLGGDKEHSWVHGVVEEICTNISRRWSKKLFQNRIQAAKTSDQQLGVLLYSKQRFDKLVAFVFKMTIVGLIMGPIFVLYDIRDQGGSVQNAVTFGFTTFFALLCSTCTTAKRHETFDATAAYCAVLVVFASPKS